MIEERFAPITVSSPPSSRLSHSGDSPLNSRPTYNPQFGVTYLRQSRDSSQVSEGNFLSTLNDYLSRNDRPYTPCLTKLPTDPSYFSSLIDPQRAEVFSHEGRATIYVGVPKQGLYDVIAITGTSVTRECGAAEMRTIGNCMGIPVCNLDAADGENYFRLEKYLKTLPEHVEG